MSERFDFVVQQTKGKRLVSVLRTAAEDLRDRIWARLNKKGTGRLYRKSGNVAYGPPDANGKRTRMPPKPGDFHQASRDGESPAPDTTRLRESSTAVQADATGHRWQVGVSAPAAATLEKVLNRPYMAPAVEDWKAAAGKKFAARRA